MLTALKKVIRVRAIRRKIARLGEGPYKPGGSSKPGHLYSPLPFPDFQDLPVQREACDERFQLMQANLPTDVARGRLVDLGCNTGFNCFRFAEIGFSSVGIDIDAFHVEIANDVASLFHANAVFKCGEVTPDVIRDLGSSDVLLFLASFQWITHARGFDFACAVLKAAMDSSTVMFFETSMGTEGRAKMPMLPDQAAIVRLLTSIGVHNEIVDLGEVAAPNAWLNKTRHVFRTRNTAPGHPAD